MNVITVFKVFAVIALLLGNLVDNSTGGERKLAGEILRTSDVEFQPHEHSLLTHIYTRILECLRSAIGHLKNDKGNLVDNIIGDERKLAGEILRTTGVEFQPHEYSLVTNIYTKVLECLRSAIGHLKQSINHSVTVEKPEKIYITNPTTRAPTESRRLRNRKIKPRTFRTITKTTKTTATITTQPKTKPVEDECGTSLPYPHQSKFLIGGGTPVRQWEMPWAVYLTTQHMGQRNQVFCGGTLISKRHVVTAAHCLTLQDSFCSPLQYFHVRVTVYYGAVCLNNLYPGCTSNHPMRAIRVKRAYAPHYYKHSCKDYDIAFLELEHEIDDRYARPICLDKMGFDMRPLYVFGWGKNHFAGQRSMNNLQKLEVRNEYYDRVFCKPHVVKCFRVGPYGESLNQGDSGGGLIGRNTDGKWNLVGVSKSFIHTVNRLVAMTFVDVSKFFDDLNYFLKSNVTTIYYFF